MKMFMFIGTSWRPPPVKYPKVQNAAGKSSEKAPTGKKGSKKGKKATENRTVAKPAVHKKKDAGRRCEITIIECYICKATFSRIYAEIFELNSFRN